MLDLDTCIWTCMANEAKRQTGSTLLFHCFIFAPKRAKTKIQGFQPFGYSVFISMINTEKLYFLKLNVTKQCVQSWCFTIFFFHKRKIIRNCSNLIKRPLFSKTKEFFFKNIINKTNLLIWPFFVEFLIHFVLSWITLVNGNLPTSFRVTIMFFVDLKILTACLWEMFWKLCPLTSRIWSPA